LTRARAGATIDPVGESGSAEPRREMSGRAFAFAIGFAGLLAAGSGVLLGHVGESRQREKLEELSSQLSGSDLAAAERIAAQKHVIVARLDARGAAILRTGPVPIAEGSIGQVLDTADAQLPPWPARAEVRAALGGNRAFGRYSVPAPYGSVLVQTLALPVGGQDVLYVLTGLFVFKFMQPPFMVLTTVIVGLFVFLVSTVLARLHRPKVERL
jgi:hypothetical protein